MVINWNSNTPHSCPRCNHDTVAAPSIWEVYTCCNCGSRFARFPRLQRFLRHVGITCEFCTERHPVPVDDKPFGYLRRRHTGVGMYAQHQFEAWLHDADDFPNHRDAARYVNTRSSRADAMADLAHWHSFLGRAEDDLSPVLAVVADERFDKYCDPMVTEEQQAGFTDGSLEVYGVGVLRAYPASHRRRGQFYADMDTFTWGLIAPSGLEGIYTKAAPEALSAHAPKL
ncbi:hypothetical protein AB0N77_21895 [Streptomyces misionensis]|uniref:hypothetical protein n=1 Tax=Streptomyces misionensis TaxID=67331 RepID=UPI003424B59C